MLAGRALSAGQSVGMATQCSGVAVSGLSSALATMAGEWEAMRRSICQDCATRVVEGPLGPISVVASSQGVRQVILGRRIGRRRGSEAAEAMAEKAARQIREYLAGRRRKFTVPVELVGLTQFQREVLEECRRIGWGKKGTYGQLARAVGRPGAARAVGQALGSNPVPIIIPCHRVIRFDGQLGGFGAGLEWKEALLEIEKRQYGW